MLKLSAKVKSNQQGAPHRLLTVTTNQHLIAPVRMKHALLLRESAVESFLGLGKDSLNSFSAVLLISDELFQSDLNDEFLSVPNLIVLPSIFDYLRDGDIVRVGGIEERVSVLFRKSSPSTSILLTERCNHYCLMCSQPPRKVDDFWLMDQAKELIRVIPTETRNIGFTGGEPTLYGEEFLSLIDDTKRHLPFTAVDVLSNGRAFKDEVFARTLGEIAHPDLQIGIPIYSDDPVTHDYIVQAKGAFGETVRGVLNLKRAGVSVEIRVVIHKQSLPRLIETCEYIARNLQFVDHVALMGLEITGFTRANLDILWVDPMDYRDRLSQAVSLLKSYGMHCSVYNHQLCLVNRDVETVYRKSISDWKNEYLDACKDCVRKSDCGGFFTTQVQYKHSENIKPFMSMD